MQPLRKIVICPNPIRDAGFELTNAIRDLLSTRGAEVSVVPLFDVYTGQNAVSEITSALADAELMVCLGGDGTILHTSKYAAAAGVPILGVNLGTLGFIADLERDGWKDIAKVLSGDYIIDERMMLTVSVVRSGKTIVSNTGLNEAAITNGAGTRSVWLTLFSDGLKICRFSGNGVVIATPTGSTGYSMSAGGPVVEPAAASMVVTPVCAHALMDKAFVLSKDRRVIVEVYDGCPAQLSVDGDPAIALERGDSVQIIRSDLITRLVHVSERSFFEVVGRKLNLAI
ncbi:MAG: NAD(+)/NADH kinase [Clostridiales bacterium]|nr:NAD(+)/NADH kinase [Clostridiales bacterium]